MKKPAAKTSKTTKKPAKADQPIGLVPTPEKRASTYREQADRRALAILTTYGRQSMATVQANDLGTVDMHAEGCTMGLLDALHLVALERAAGEADQAQAFNKGRKAEREYAASMKALFGEKAAP